MMTTTGPLGGKARSLGLVIAVTAMLGLGGCASGDSLRESCWSIADALPVFRDALPITLGGLSPQTLRESADALTGMAVRIDEEQREIANPEVAAGVAKIGTELERVAESVRLAADAFDARDSMALQQRYDELAERIPQLSAAFGEVSRLCALEG